MLNRRITWEGTLYYEADIGEELFEAMLADNNIADESQDIGDSSHARDRIFMRWTFFGRLDARAYIVARLEELGF
jgi:hypothetical protein